MNYTYVIVVILAIAVTAFLLVPKQPTCSEGAYYTKAICVNSKGFCTQICQDIKYVCKNNKWIAQKPVSKEVCK